MNSEHFAVAVGLLFSSLRLATPLIFASLGGYVSERSGTINIALEGLSLLGAFFAAVGAHAFHNPWIGLLCGVLASILFASLHGTLSINLGANQIISGLSINFLGLGIPPLLAKAFFDYSGGTPQLSAQECIPKIFDCSPLVGFAFISAIGMMIIHRHHRWGQYLRFAGENPDALQSQGISVKVVRWQGMVVSGFFCGLAGAFLSIDHGTAFSRNMTAGRGFIALAALIVGRWTPGGALLASLAFGAIESSQILLQGITLPSGSPIPVQWIQIIPYAMTLLVLAARSSREQLAPKALGLPY